MRVFAVLEVELPEQQVKLGRIIQIGACSDDRQVGQELTENVTRQITHELQERGLMPKPPKPVSAEICLYLTKQYFRILGRPTTDDYIELDARTDRGR